MQYIYDRVHVPSTSAGGGVESADAASRPPAVEEPPPLPPAPITATLPQHLEDTSPTNVPVDSWEAEAEDPILTPDQDDEELVEDDEEVVKVPKKKPVKTEETKSKKEHVNVVFIGHVGEWHAPLAHDMLKK